VTMVFLPSTGHKLPGMVEKRGTVIAGFVPFCARAFWHLFRAAV
jgi:hypothetical protein